MAKTGIIVLGMHRSGTSCLTGSLEQAGVYLGDVNRDAPHNAKGNQENRAIMALNDAVLCEHHATWDNPPKSVIQWSNALKNTRDLLLSNYPDNQTFGFKDPRTLFTLEGWLEALPEARLVGTFRHPNAVVQSLNRRVGLQPALPPLDLWKQYNLRLLKYAAELQFPLINFDSSAEQYLLDFKMVVKHFDLSQTLNIDSQFFDATLRNSQLSGAAAEFIDTESQAIYEQLLQHMVNGD
jgi:hypothetical protein